MTKAKRTNQVVTLEVTRKNADNPQGGYSRKQPLIEVEFTCSICGATTIRLQYPGPIPTVCQPAEGQKQSPCQKKAALKRVQEWRKENPGKTAQAQRRRRAEQNPDLR